MHVPDKRGARQFKNQQRETISGIDIDLHAGLPIMEAPAGSIDEPESIADRIIRDCALIILSLRLKFTSGVTSALPPALLHT